MVAVKGFKRWENHKGIDGIHERCAQLLGFCWFVRAFEIIELCWRRILKDASLRHLSWCTKFVWGVHRSFSCHPLPPKQFFVCGFSFCIFLLLEVDFSACLKFKPSVRVHKICVYNLKWLSCFCLYPFFSEWGIERFFKFMHDFIVLGLLYSESFLSHYSLNARYASLFSSAVTVGQQKPATIPYEPNIYERSDAKPIKVSL